MSPLIWARRGQQASYIYNWLIIPVKVDIQTLQGEMSKTSRACFHAGFCHSADYICLWKPAMSANSETTSRECKPLAVFFSFQCWIIFSSRHQKVPNVCRQQAWAKAGSHLSFSWPRELQKWVFLHTSDIFKAIKHWLFFLSLVQFPVIIDFQ